MKLVYHYLDPFEVDTSELVEVRPCLGPEQYDPEDNIDREPGYGPWLRALHINDVGDVRTLNLLDAYFVHAAPPKCLVAEGPGLLCEGDWIVKLTNSKVMIRTTMELSEANFVVRVVQPVPRRTLGARARRSPANPQPRK